MSLHICMLCFNHFRVSTLFLLKFSKNTILAHFFKFVLEKVCSHWVGPTSRRSCSQTQTIVQNELFHSDHSQIATVMKRVFGGVERSPLGGQNLSVSCHTVYLTYRIKSSHRLRYGSPPDRVQVADYRPTDSQWFIRWISSGSEQA